MQFFCVLSIFIPWDVYQFIMFTPAMRLCDILLADSLSLPSKSSEGSRSAMPWENLNLGGSGGIQWEETAARILFDGERAAVCCSTTRPISRVASALKGYVGAQVQLSTAFPGLLWVKNQKPKVRNR